MTKTLVMAMVNILIPTLEIPIWNLTTPNLTFSLEPLVHMVFYPITQPHVPLLVTLEPIVAHIVL